MLMKTKADFKAMSKDELIEYILALKLNMEMAEISVMSESRVIQKLNSHFLHNMKRPNDSKTRVKQW